MSKLNQHEFLRRLDSELQRRTAKKVARQKIEHLYQASMDLRDSLPTPENWNYIESIYLAAYLKAYNRTQDVLAFRQATRIYRKALRKSEATHAD